MEASNQTSLFTITWTIENLSLYTTRMKEDLVSPDFKMQNSTEHTISILLTSGEWNQKDIRVTVLQKVIDLLQCDSKWIEFSLLRSNGEVLECSSSFTQLVNMGTAVKLAVSSYRRPEIFRDEKILQELLKDNILIICCKIYGLELGEHSFIHGIRTVLHQCNLVWHLKTFPCTKKFRLASRRFTIVVSKPKHGTSMMVKVIQTDKEVHFGYCIVDTYQLFNTHLFHLTYNKTQSPNWQAPVMLSESAFNGIRNGSLALHCEFTVGVEEVSCTRLCEIPQPQAKDETSRKTTQVLSGNVQSGRLRLYGAETPKTKGKGSKISHSQTQKELDCSKTVASTMQSGMLSLYENRKFCDVTLKTRGASFPVHKTVLCAMSSVFCAHFDSYNSSVIHVRDVNPETLRRMLMFLYTESLGDVSWEIASGLYAAATKCDIQSLKEQCLTVLLKKLSIANACDALVLADTFQERGLMQAVRDFVFDHDEVVCSEEWRELEKKKPQLTIQMFREMHFKKRKN